MILSPDSPADPPAQRVKFARRNTHSGSAAAGEPTDDLRIGHACNPTPMGRRLWAAAIDSRASSVTVAGGTNTRHPHKCRERQFITSSGL